jgi:uncharacterized coiled-coil DUF342 family protein
MNTLQNVYDKLNSKTELASNKVELALLDDIKQIDGQLSNKLNKYSDQIENAEKWILGAVESKPIVTKDFEKYNALFIKATTAAKELGIQYPYEKEYNNLKQKVENLNARYLRLRSVL